MDNRLFEALAQFNPQELERVFGDEQRLAAPDPMLRLAPVERVVIIAESFLPKVDGVSKTAFLALRYLQETGRDVLVFAPDIAPQRIGPTQVIPLPSLGMPLAPETRIALPSLSINHYLDTFKPDIIHMFSPALLSVSGMLAGRRRNIPIIANYQTDLPSYAEHYGLPLFAQPTRDWLRYIHNGCHLTLVPSTYTMHQLQDWGYHRLRRWGRGVDSERFNPRHYSPDWRERLLNGRNPNSLVCIYVGRLANEKRVDLLLEIARTPGVALTIIGDGALRSDLEMMFAGTGTHFMGYLYGSDLSKAFASADVFTFPGAAETFGQVVQEALASGLPAIVLNAGGVTDLVTPGETGFQCEDDPFAFATAIRRLRDDRDLLRRMSQNARYFAEQRPWSKVMAQLENYYRDAILMNERFTRLFPPSGFNLLIPGFLKTR